MSRFFLKAYFYLRRNFSSRLFFIIENVLVFLHKNTLEKANYANKVHPFEPVEVQLSQNLSERELEIDELVEAYKSKNLPDLIDSLSGVERNKAFKWNSFYPLYSLLNTDNSLHSHSYEYSLQIVTTFVLCWIQKFLFDGRANKFCWYDMADAFRLMLFYKIFQDVVDRASEKEISNIQYAIHIHEFFLTKDSALQKGNHQIFQLLARLCIYSLRNNKELIDSERNRLVNFFRKQFSDEGFHVEHSPEYHLWANFVFRKIFEIYSFSELQNQLSLLEKRSNLFFTPDGKLPLIGDSGWDNIDSYRDLFFKPGPLKKDVFSQDYLISTHRDAGWYFISLISSNSNVHKHKDSSTFELFMDGSKIITDSGKYAYTNTKLSRSIKSENSHNISFLKENVSIFSTQKYNLHSHRVHGNFTIVSVKANVGEYAHERKFVYNSSNHLTIIDVFNSAGNEICTNLNLVKGNTYQLRKENEYKAEYFSEELDTAISFLNIHNHDLQQNFVSETYGEVYEEKSIKAYSKKMIITSIFCGVKNITKRIRNGAYRIEAAEKIINIQPNAVVDIL